MTIFIWLTGSQQIQVYAETIEEARRIIPLSIRDESPFVSIIFPGKVVLNEPFAITLYGA